MRISILIAAAGLFLASCHGGHVGVGEVAPSRQGFAGQQKKLADVGQPAPDFTLEDRDGNMVSLSDFRGKPVLIEFWASWCPFCMEEMPELEVLYKEHQGKVEILAVDRVGALGETREKALEAADRLGVTYPILFDEGEKVYKLYRFAGNPSPLAYYVDQEGIVVDRKAGPKTKEEVQKLFHQMLEDN